MSVHESNDAAPPPTQAGALAWAAAADSDDVRAGVAANPNTPPEVLERLSRDSAVAVRRAVLENQHTPPAVVAALQRDAEVKRAVKVARRYVSARDPRSVQVADLDELGVPAPGWLVDGRMNVHQYVVGSPNDVAKVLGILATVDRDTGNGYVRAAIAEYPGTPAHMLADFARDRVAVVRFCAATNPATPVRELVQLARDPEALVRRGAARNPNLPDDALAALTGDTDPLVRRFLAANPVTPADALVTLAQRAKAAPATAPAPGTAAGPMPTGACWKCGRPTANSYVFYTAEFTGEYSYISDSRVVGGQRAIEVFRNQEKHVEFLCSRCAPKKLLVYSGSVAGGLALFLIAVVVAALSGNDTATVPAILGFLAFFACGAGWFAWELRSYRKDRPVAAQDGSVALIHLARRKGFGGRSLNMRYIAANAQGEADRLLKVLWVSARR